MKVVITGGGGFLGKKLARRILQQGSIAGEDGKPRKVAELLLFDVARASGPGLDDPRVKAIAGDIDNPSARSCCATTRARVISAAPRCGCRRSACAPAFPIRQLPPGRARWCASR